MKWLLYTCEASSDPSLYSNRGQIKLGSPTSIFLEFLYKLESLKDKEYLISLPQYFACFNNLFALFLNVTQLCFCGTYHHGVSTNVFRCVHSGNCLISL